MGRRIVRRRAAAGLVALACLVAGTGASAAPAPVDGVDVVVRATSSEAAAAAVAAAGGRVEVALGYLGAVAAEVPETAVDALEARGDVTVAPDEELTVAATDLVDAGPATVADQTQLAALSLPEHWSPAAGAGVGVALLDTGVADVPELGDRLVRGPDLSGDGDGVDRHGHGTFMAGLIAGDGRVAGTDAPRFGVAPGAHVVSVKLAGRDGRTSVSRVLEGVGWVIANQDQHGIRVLNLSLGVPTKRAPQADPLAAAVEAAWAAGLTVVTASGNDGPGTVTSPGRSPWVVTVGATDTVGTATTADDVVASWSGDGKVTGDRKPEVLAPGVSVISLRAPGSAVEQDHPEAHVDDRYLRGSGTSMATALVSGAAAVLAEHRPFATPDDLKGALASTTVDVDGSSAGAVDLAAADAAEPDPSWRQDHRIAFGGLRGALRHGMPWSRDGVPGVEETWSRARWLDGTWQRARWLDEDWARARWLDDGWSRARWLEASFARARWLDVNFSRARWLDVDFSRARWLAEGWDGTEVLDAPASWGGAATTADAVDEPRGRGQAVGRGNGRGRGRP